MKVLFLPHRVPFPPNKGDRIRSYHLLRFLASFGDVDMATLSDEPVTARTREALDGLCNKVAVVPLGAKRWAQGAASWVQGRTVTEGLFRSRRLAEIVSAWSSDVSYDATIVVCSSMVQYLTACRRRPRKTIAALVDVDSEKWKAYSESSRGLRKMLFRSEASRLRLLEEQLADRVDAITLVSDAEAKLYRTVTPRGRVYGIPNGVDLDYFRPPPLADSLSRGEPNSAVFVGALNYQANVDGLVWYCQNVWPRLREKQSNAVFRIVGRRPTAVVDRLGRVEGVEIIGEVDDVRPFVRQAQVVVAPLAIARGIQNKVLEALAMGKAVIASPEALSGISLDPVHHAVRAKSVDEWVIGTLRLWSDPKARLQLGAEGRKFVERNHSWDACLAPFRHLVGETGELHDADRPRQAFQQSVSDVP